MSDMAARAGAALAAALLAMVGAGFAVAAVYLGWREVLSAPWAAAVTSACLLALAGLIHLVAQARRRKPAPASSLLAALPILGLIRAKPGLSVLAALGLGALLEQLERRRR